MEVLSTLISSVACDRSCQKKPLTPFLNCTNCILLRSPILKFMRARFTVNPNIQLFKGLLMMNHKIWFRDRSNHLKKFLIQVPFRLGPKYYFRFFERLQKFPHAYKSVEKGELTSYNIGFVTAYVRKNRPRESVRILSMWTL